MSEKLQVVHCTAESLLKCLMAPLRTLPKITPAEHGSQCGMLPYSCGLDVQQEDGFLVKPGEQIRQADGVIVTPDNFSVPGGLKNAIIAFRLPDQPLAGNRY